MIKFLKNKIKDLEIIVPKKITDNRGYFSRLFCSNLFLKKGLNKIVQVNKSFSKKKHTVRGMHYQLPPFSEDKIVGCSKGKILDVAIDLRKNSKTLGKWHSEILSENNNKMFLIPKGFAHGFMTLEDNCEVIYYVSEFYKPHKERGLFYKDPFFSIKWPATGRVISKKDKEWSLIKNENINEKLI